MSGSMRREEVAVALKVNPHRGPQSGAAAGRSMTSILDIADGSCRMESKLDMGTEIKNRVKELRLQRGWTQQELAEAVGVSRQSINSIERNRYVPSLLLALTFARVFKRPTEEIFELE